VGTSIKDCKVCGAPIRWLTQYNGRNGAFEPDPIRGGTVPADARWYISRSRGAVPGSIATGRGLDEAYFVEHNCIRAVRGIGDEALAALTIPKMDAPRMKDLPPLDERFAYAYRWASNFLHILSGPHTSLCGARADVPLPGRETDRMATMPICATCLERYNARGRRRVDEGLARDA